ncbi:MAG: Maf family protein [Thiohalomonadaceae bacterium]
MIILASSSPRRHELLKQINVAHEVLSVAVDESRWPDEAAEDYVLRLALAKAQAVRALRRDSPVLGADTAVVIDDHILGKPHDRAAGLAMLAQLSGRTHYVYSGVVLVNKTGETQSNISISAVTFRSISPTECEAYWDSGEPLDKAGAYAIQGLGAIFVAHLAGSYSGVMGLPLFETAAMLNWHVSS